MNVFKAKLRLVFIPLVVMALVVIAGYSFLYWVFCIKLKVISLKEDVVEYWLPVALGFATVLLFIRSRVHLLKLDADDGRIRGLYYIAGAAVMAAPLVFLLPYLDTATGKLIALGNIREISARKTEKFYTVDSFALNKTSVGVESVIAYSGKHNEHLNFDIYFAVPFVESSTQPVSTAPAFLAKKYHQQLSGSLPDNEWRIEWRSFREQSQHDFDDETLHFTYLERMGNTDDRDNFIIAARKSPLFNKGSPLMLKPQDEPFENRNGKRLAYTFIAFGIGVLVWFIMVIIPGLHKNKAKEFTNANLALARKQLESAISFIKPKKGFAATPVLIMMNTLVFIVMVLAGHGFINFYSRDLIPAGAMYGPLLEQGEWWRLVTAMFLHGGFMHLLMNMFSLYLAGLFTEASLGTKKFLLVYFLSGIGAGIISLAWHSNPVVAVGASGAIFGLFGVILAFAVFNKFDPDMRGTMFILLACTAGYSLLIGLVSKGIDNSAHLGGLITGFFLGCFLNSNTKYNPPSLKYSKKKKNQSTANSQQ